MHTRDNGQRHLWLLSGTGEGPQFAEALIRKGWKVTVSVVSSNAAKSYSELPIEALRVGEIGGTEGIRKVFLETELLHSGFDLVVDATHPFAVVITSELSKVCEELSQPLLRYERPLESPSGAEILPDLHALSYEKLAGMNLLLAIGIKNLYQGVESARQAGANVFVRVLPNPLSLRKGLSCDLPANHLVALYPFKSIPVGGVETSLCKRWGIDGVVCKQSGGLTQKMWQEICNTENIQLWLLKRPIKSSVGEVFFSFTTLMHRISNFE